MLRCANTGSNIEQKETSRSIDRRKEACWDWAQTSKVQNTMKSLTPQGHHRHPLLLLFTQYSQHNLLVTTATLTRDLLQSVTTLSTHTHRWQVHTCEYCIRTRPCKYAHSLCTNASVRARSETGEHTSTQSQTILSLFSWCVSAKWFSLWALLLLSMFKLVQMDKTLDRNQANN